MTCNKNFEDLHDLMCEILEPLDLETVRDFHNAFKTKMEKLKNEQATNLQKDPGAS